jgi:hypothetical protein
LQRVVCTKDGSGRDGDGRATVRRHIQNIRLVGLELQLYVDVLHADDHVVEYALGREGAMREKHLRESRAVR